MMDWILAEIDDINAILKEEGNVGGVSYFGIYILLGG